MVTDIIPSHYETIGGDVGREVKVDGTYSSVDDCTDQLICTDQLMGGYFKIDYKESLAGYSEVAQLNSVVKAIYSDPDIAPQQTFTSPPDISLQHNVPQDSEYAVFGAPEIPTKSDILVEYLETKYFNVRADKKPEVSMSDDGGCGDDGDGGGGDRSDMGDRHLSQ